MIQDQPKGLCYLFTHFLITICHQLILWISFFDARTHLNTFTIIGSMNLLCSVKKNDPLLMSYKSDEFLCKWLMGDRTSCYRHVGTWTHGISKRSKHMDFQNRKFTDFIRKHYMRIEPFTTMGHKGFFQRGLNTQTWVPFLPFFVQVEKNRSSIWL